MYTVYVFTLSGWARSVRDGSEEELKLQKTRGFKVEGTKGSKMKCDKRVEEINRALPQKEVTDLLVLN